MVSVIFSSSLGGIHYAPQILFFYRVNSVNTTTFRSFILTEFMREYCGLKTTVFITKQKYKLPVLFFADLAVYYPPKFS